VNAIVGTDGRLHQPQVRTPLSDAHASCALRPLPLWRFTPARLATSPSPPAWRSAPRFGSTDAAQEREGVSCQVRALPTEHGSKGDPATSSASSRRT